MTKLAPIIESTPKPAIAALLDHLESFYGPQQPTWPTDPWLFLIWWHCGYPASDATCTKGWLALNAKIGTDPEALLNASPDTLAAALKPGGMVPELRAMRLKEIALRVKNECGGDLNAALHGPIDKATTLLKKFPNIAGPGAYRILLFGHIAPVAAIPSNCPQVLVRLILGCERENYNVTYHEAQDLLATNIPATFDARTRAYLLLKQHGQTLCKRTKPKCEQCPVNSSCAFFSGKTRGRSTTP